jgi:hypothetical protein
VEVVGRRACRFGRHGDNLRWGYILCVGLSHVELEGEGMIQYVLSFLMQYGGPLVLMIAAVAATAIPWSSLTGTGSAEREQPTPALD